MKACATSAGSPRPYTDAANVAAAPQNNRSQTPCTLRSVAAPIRRNASAVNLLASQAVTQAKAASASQATV